MSSTLSSRPAASSGSVAAQASDAAGAGALAVPSKPSAPKEIFVIHAPALKFINPVHACAYVPSGKGAETKKVVESGPRPPLLVPDVVVKCRPVPLGSVLPMVVPPGLKWVQLGQTAILHPPPPSGKGNNNNNNNNTSPWWVAELSTYGVKLVRGSKNEPVVKYVSWAEASSSLTPYNKSTGDRYQANGSKRPTSKAGLHGVGGSTSASQQQTKVTAAAAAAANAVGRGKFPSSGTKSLGSIRPGTVVPPATSTSTSSATSSTGSKKKKSPTNAGSSASATSSGAGRKLTAAQKALQISMLKRELADFYRKVNKEKVSQVHVLVNHFGGDRAKLNQALFDTYRKNLDTEKDSSGNSAKTQQAKPNAAATATATKPTSPQSMVPTWVPTGGGGILGNNNKAGHGGPGKPGLGINQSVLMPVPVGTAATAATAAAIAMGGVCGLGLKVAVRKPGTFSTSPTATIGAGGLSSFSLAKQLRWADGQIIKVEPQATTVSIIAPNTDNGRQVRVPHAGGVAGKYIKRLPALYANLLDVSVIRPSHLKTEHPQVATGKVVSVEAPKKMPDGHILEAKFELSFPPGPAGPSTVTVGTKDLLPLILPRQLPQREQLRRKDLENRLSNFYSVKNRERLPKVSMLTSHFKYNEKDLNDALRQTYECDLSDYIKLKAATTGATTAAGSAADASRKTKATSPSSGNTYAKKAKK